MVRQKVSTAGWVCFVVLLICCFILCWIGLLMKEDERHCGREQSWLMRPTPSVMCNVISDNERCQPVSVVSFEGRA